MGTLWIDATDLKKWKGPKTGIPRVVDCLVREILKLHDAGGKPCVFDETAATFRPFEAADTLYPDPSPSRVSDGRLHRRLEPLVSAVRDKIPQDLWNPLRVVGSDAYHLLVDSSRLISSVGRWLLHRDDSPRVPPADELEGVIRFSHDDVLLALGSTWGCRDYPDAVANLKQQSAFKVAHLVHDLIPAKFPHFYPAGFADEFRDWLTSILRLADVILVISENSKKDLELLSRQNGVRCPPIRVIRLGDEVRTSGLASAPASHVQLGARFVLCVGTIEARKNQALLYQVWSRLLETHGASIPKLVIVGHPGLLARDFLALVKEDPVLREHVVVLTDTTDPELVWLYEHCLFTVYPSVYEGWGLPVAESVARGKYCITSASASLPEIAGDLLDYHSPWDSGECYTLVERAIQDARFLTDRENAIRARYKRTSWKETAESVVSFLGRTSLQP
jgi:glycosyltransferase involved in cell wall biosynthesis